MQHTIVSQCVPVSPIICGDLQIEKNFRICVSKKLDGGGKIDSNYDSVLVSSKIETKEAFYAELQDWLVYHAFVLDDLSGIQQYKDMDLLENIGEVAYPVDYENCIKRVYFLSNSEEIGTNSFNYKYGYEKYKKFDESKKNAIKNFLLNFDSSQTKHLNFLDARYWQAVLYCSILEFITGKRKKCSGNATCDFDACRLHKNGVEHDMYSYREHVHQYLKVCIDNTERINEYMAVIEKTYKSVRNGAVHGSKMPYFQWNAPEPGVTEIYDLNRAAEEHNTDTIALTALLDGLRDIVRNLLLNKLFGLSVFPKIRSLQATTIGSH